MKCPSGFVPKSQQFFVPCFMPSRDCVPCTGSSCIRRNHTGECMYCSGGDEWGGLCQNGAQQSPVKVEWPEVKIDDSELFYFVTNYTQNAEAVMVNTGVGLTIYGNFGEVVLDGVEYIAYSILVHAPAEHLIEGSPRPVLELQVFHHKKGNNGTGPDNTKIISVLFDQDLVTNSLEIAKAFDGYLPQQKSESKNITINLNNIIDDTKPMLFYNGSLTLPPCTEGISWAIQMGVNSQISRELTAKLDSLFKKNPLFARGRGNNRSPQKLNNRTFLLRSGCGKNGAIACPRATISDLDEN